MSEFKAQSQQAKDFKERFEFKLTMKSKADGVENIICQRYFKINYYNPLSVKSYDLVDTIRECADLIDGDLKSKTQIYLEIFAPRYFDTVEDMDKYFSNPKNARLMRMGEGIIVNDDNEHSYFWDGSKPKKLDYRFNDGELANGLTESDAVDYKFAFYDYGIDYQTNTVPRELCSTTWTGIYPKYIRNSIDLSNKKGRMDGEDLSRLSFEQYLLYKLVQGRQDLVYAIIKNICQTCSEQDDDWYQVSDVYKGKDGKTVEYYNTNMRTSANRRFKKSKKN